MAGLNNRSQRENEVAPGTSFASWWNALFDEPQKLAEVLHGTTFRPPPCDDVQPVGSVPGAALSKFSFRSVVYTGVPDCRVRWCVIDPSAVVTSSNNSIGVPATKERRTCNW